MKAASKAVLNAALALPDEDRATIAEKLFESLPLTTDGLDNESLSAELKRRRREYERDPSVARPWSEVKHLR